MLSLYTTQNFFDENDIIGNNDIFFDFHTQYLVSSDDEELKYDGAVILGKSEDSILIKTKFGNDNAYMTNLSTGVKTLLNLKYLRDDNIAQHIKGKKAVDITDCGSNVLLDVFRLAMEKGMPVILRHTSLPEFNDISINVNNKKVVTNDSELFAILCDGGEQLID